MSNSRILNAAFNQNSFSPATRWRWIHNRHQVPGHTAPSVWSKSSTLRMACLQLHEMIIILTGELNITINDAWGKRLHCLYKLIKIKLSVLRGNPVKSTFNSGLFSHISCLNKFSLQITKSCSHSSKVLYHTSCKDRGGKSPSIRVPDTKPTC